MRRLRRYYQGFFLGLFFMAIGMEQSMIMKSWMMCFITLICLFIIMKRKTVNNMQQPEYLFCIVSGTPPRVQHHNCLQSLL